MVWRGLACSFAFAVLALIGDSPTAQAATYTESLPAGCSAPTLSGPTVFCNDTPLFTIVGYPCASELVLGTENGSYTVSCATPNYSGLYWVASESGQGYTLTHQANAIFLLAYVYGNDRTAQWLSMMGRLDDSGAYVGDVVYSTGAPGSAFPHYVSPGSMTPNDDGTIRLKIGETVKTLQRYDIGDGTPLPACRFGAAPGSIVTGLWWNPSQSGAGFGIHDQGGRLFLTWYSFDAAGNPRWASALLTKATPAAIATIATAPTYSGLLYSTVGPAFSAAVFERAAVAATPIAPVSVALIDANHATFTVATDAIALTRFTFAAPGTACQ